METLIAAAHECAAAAHGECGAIVNRAARVLNLSPGRTHALVAKTARSLAWPRRARSAPTREKAPSRMPTWKSSLARAGRTCATASA